MLRAVGEKACWALQQHPGRRTTISCLAYGGMRAYRKLAKRLHPDVAPGKEGEFMEIAKAHEVLSDPEQRKRYDAFGEEGLAGTAGTGGAGGADGFPFDVFANLFGGAGGFAGFGGGGGGASRGASGGGPRVKFNFSGEMPEYMKSFGFSNQQKEDEEDWDADLYGDVPQVEELNPSNYKQFLAEKGDLVFLEIYNPHCGPCRVFKLEYFAAANCRSHPKLPLCKLGRRYPSVFFYGPDKGGEPILYTGKKKYEDLGNFVTEKLAKYYTVLTLENMESWLIRNPEKQKLVFFARKRPISAEWAVAAFRFKSRLDLGIVYPSEKDLVASYFTEPTEFNAGRPQPYLQIPSLLKITDIDTLNGEWKQVRGLNADQVVSQLGVFAAQSLASKVNPLHALTRRRMKLGECTPEDSQFCIILLLPSKGSAFGSARETYSALKELAPKYKTDPVKLVYVDAGKNPLFLTAFGFVPGIKQEVMVAYRPKRGRYSVLEGPFDKHALQEAIDNVLGGSQLPNVLKSTPELSAPVKRPSAHDEL
ncbi:hypothetical protein Esti_002265 [Eimeria stiedai]